MNQRVSVIACLVGVSALVAAAGAWGMGGARPVVEGHSSASEGMQRTGVAPPSIDAKSYKFFDIMQYQGTQLVGYYGEPGDAYVTVNLSAWNHWVGKVGDSVPYIQDSSHYAKFVTTIANAGAKDGYQLHSIQLMERGGWDFIAGDGAASGGGWALPTNYVLLFEKREGGAFGR